MLGLDECPACECSWVDTVGGFASKQECVFDVCLCRSGDVERCEAGKQFVCVISHPYFGIHAWWGEDVVFDSVFHE